MGTFAREMHPDDGHLTLPKGLTAEVREALRIARSEPVLRRTRVATQSTEPFRELTACHCIWSEYCYCVDSSHIAHTGTTVREKAP